MQVAPAELEDVIRAHPLVADCAVIPVEDEEAGELPRAYVVRKEVPPTPTPGSAALTELTEEDVAEFVKERVAYYKWLRGGVVFVESIPKTASGKTLRRLVIDQDRQPRS
jgi:acyl-CoA synthetase (AMP-forming)/AMP-acid ligase II